MDPKIIMIEKGTLQQKISFKIGQKITVRRNKIESIVEIREVEKRFKKEEHLNEETTNSYMTGYQIWTKDQLVVEIMLSPSITLYYE